MADNDVQINELEKWVFQSENRDAFVKQLIPDTESHYYYTLLQAIQKSDGKLTEELEKQLSKFKKFKTKRSRGLQLRYLLKQYDSTQDVAKKTEIIKKLNKSLLKIQFNHEAPKHLQGKTQFDEKNKFESDTSSQDSVLNIEQRNNCEDFSDEEEFEIQEQIAMPQQMMMNQAPQQMMMQQQQQQAPQQMMMMQQEQQQAPMSTQVQKQEKSEESDIDEKEEEQNKDKSVFPEYLTNIQRYLKKAYKNTIDFNILNFDSIQQLDVQKICQTTELTSAQILNFMNNYNLADLSNQELKDLIDFYVKVLNKNSKKLIAFDNYTIFRRLTLEQLKYLRETYPDFIKNQDFVAELFAKQFHSNEILNLDLPEDQETKRKQLLVKYKWALDLPVKFKSMGDQILFEYLDYGIQCNHYDFDMLIEYIKNPKEVCNSFNKTQMSRQREQYKQYNYDSYWHNVHNFQVSKWNQQNQLIESYLLKYYQSNNSTQIAPFDEFFAEVYLNRLLIRAQLYNGATNIQGVSDYFTPKEIQSLHSVKELKICVFNKRHFNENEEVKLFLEMQNVEKLQVKIFEIHAENYYLKTHTQFDDNLDLDGLTASEQINFDFRSSESHPCKKIIREFKFDTIKSKKQGIFVIEFFGNDIASRIVIKKGQLNLIQRQCVAGHFLRIVDQFGKVQVPPTDQSYKVGLWVEKKFYESNPKGEIIVPYDPKLSTQKNQQVIIVGQNFSVLSTMQLYGENYTFDAFFFYNEEQFLMGQKAFILVQPRLLLNSEIAPLDVIEDGEVTIQTTTDDNIPATTKYDKLKFKNSEDYNAKFQVPAKLKTINVTVTGNIKKSVGQNNSEDQENSEKIKISKSFVLNFNSHRGESQFCGLYMKKDPQGNYELLVLGKNGEPKKDIEITLRYRLKFLNQESTINLITNERGAVNLGQLNNVLGIQAISKANQDIAALNKSWVLDNDIENGCSVNLPSSIRICEGEDLNIPFVSYVHSSKGIHNDNFLFLKVTELNFNNLQAQKYRVLENSLNKFEKKGQGIVAKGLKAGDYFFRILSTGKFIKVKVVQKAKRWSRSAIFTPEILYDKKDGSENMLEPIYLETFQHQLDEEKKTNNVKLNFKINPELATKNVRVHILAFQQYSNRVNKPGVLNQKFYKPFLETPLNLKSVPTKFMSNRHIADELSYVFDRKQATRFTGNSLEKPQILLKKQYVRDTTVQSENLAGGQDYQDIAENRDLSYCQDQQKEEDMQSSEDGICQSYLPVMKSKKMNYTRKVPAPNGIVQPGNENLVNYESFINAYAKNTSIDNFLNILQTPAFQLVNQVPDENGNLEFEISDAGKGIYSGLQIIVSTPYHLSTYYKDLKTQQQEFLTRDLTQKTNLKQGKFYSIFRNSHLAPKGNDFKIEDITCTEFSFIDSLGKLHDLVQEVSKFRATEGQFRDWEFLKTWHKLTPNEKLRKYNEFQCTEVNFFLYCKDIEFFDEVIKPFLVNKLEPTLVDLFLLNQYDNALELYDNVEVFDDLNALEHCLIIYMLVRKDKISDAQNYLSYFENTQKCKKTDIESDKKIFDIALNQIDKTSKELKQKIQQTAIQSTMQQVSQNRNATMNIQQSLRSNMNINNYSNMNMNMNNNCNIQQISQAPPQRMYQQQQQQQVYYNNNENCNSDSSYSDDDGPSLQRRTSGFMIPNNSNKFDAFEPSHMKKRGVKIESYNPLGVTKEYCEKNYYYQKEGTGKAHFVPINAFWLDFGRHIIQTKTLSGFLSKNILYACSCVTEMICALGASSISNETPDLKQQTKEKELQIQPEADLLVFTKEIKETVSKFRNDILINQRFYDPKNMYTYDEEDPSIQYNKDVEQFVINKIYGCQVIITNSSDAQQQLQILHEVPQGSIPVNVIEYTKSQLKVIAAYTTTVLTYFFYFPAEGEFSLYPANVSKDGQVFAVAKDQQLKVVKSIVVNKMETLDQILTQGSKEDILSFIASKNILNHKIFNFSDIYHLLRDKDFYLKLTKILKQKRIFNHSVFSYSVYHGDHETLRDFLNIKQYTTSIQSKLHYISSSLVKTPQEFITGGLSFKLLEYYPLANSRVHMLKVDQVNILNVDFKNHYLKFLSYLAEKPVEQHCLTDKLALIYYLLLQERVNEAIQIFNKLTPPNQDNSNNNTPDTPQDMLTNTKNGQLQYDYIAAYLNFYDGYPNFTRAREIIEKYLDYPIIGWRNLFYEMANQLGEYDGEELQEDNLLDDFKDAQKKKIENQKNADKEPLLQVKLEGKTIIMEHKNLETSQLVVSYYVIDLEVFFSKKPFLSSIYDDFGYLKPSEQKVITPNDSNPEGLNITKLEVCENLQNQNVFVQVSNAQKKSGAIYFSTSLKVQLFETYGQLKTIDANEKPLSRVYIKAFSKLKNGSVKFHKDGYTDLRGKFDYLSLNNETGTDIEKFALFIMSDDLGCLIKEAIVPSQLNRVGDTVQLRSHGFQKQHAIKNKTRAAGNKYWGI